MQLRLKFQTLQLIFVPSLPRNEPWKIFPNARKIASKDICLLLEIKHLEPITKEGWPNTVQTVRTTWKSCDFLYENKVWKPNIFESNVLLGTSLFCVRVLLIINSGLSRTILPWPTPDDFPRQLLGCKPGCIRPYVCSLGFQPYQFNKWCDQAQFQIC